MHKTMFQDISESPWQKLTVVGRRLGHHVMLPNLGYGEEVYENFDLWLGVRGRCTVEMLGQTFEMRAGRIVLVPPRVTVRKFTGSQKSLGMWYFHFTCHISGKIVSDATPYVDPSQLSLTLPDLPTIALVAEADAIGLDEKLHSIRHRPQDDLGQLMASITLMNAIWHLRAAYVGFANTTSENRLEQATQFMGHYLSSPLTLEDIAKHVHVSRETLTRLFKTHYHVSPMRYFTRLRMTRASELLGKNIYSISKIARICGYSSAEYFNRVFNKSFNMSPRAYRKHLADSS